MYIYMCIGRGRERERVWSAYVGKSEKEVQGDLRLRSGFSRRLRSFVFKGFRV